MFKSEKDALDSMVKNSFQRDFIDCPSNICSGTKNEEEIRAETIMEKTFIQTQDGRWEIGLLWNEDNTQLPESRSVAWRRMNYLEKKIEENEVMKKQYCEQLNRTTIFRNNYIQKGYARKLSIDEIKNNTPVAADLRT
jgi:hypothetical protein